MASTNPFDLLGDNDNDDPSQLIAAAQAQQAAAAALSKKSSAPAVAGQQPVKQANLPSKSLPPSEAVREARNEAGRGGGRNSGRGGGRDYGRGGGRDFSRGRGGDAFNREPRNNNKFVGNNNGYAGEYKPSGDGGDAEKTTEHRSYGGPRPYRGGRGGGYSNGEVGEGERPRRDYERRSGTGRGSEFKRDGAGRGNWGTPTDEISPETEEPLNENEKSVAAEKHSGEEDVSKESPVAETEVKEPEPEDKEMTLEEYEKVLEEKRKALLALKTEERKVDLDKDLKSMQQLSSKKNKNEIFAKLGSDKSKGKEAAEKEEKAKKSLSINEFLKPAEGDKYYNPSGGRGRGGRGGRGPRGGGYTGGGNTRNVQAPFIGDTGLFPSLGAK